MALLILVLMVGCSADESSPGDSVPVDTAEADTQSPTDVPTTVGDAMVDDTVMGDTVMGDGMSRLPDAADGSGASDAADVSDTSVGADADTTVEPPSIDGANWMRDLLAQYPEKELALVDIAMPRSHDTGTYLLADCGVGAGACNTQTQHLNMTEQLEAGARFFDIRPRVNDAGEYVTYHRIGCDDLGCDGDSMASILAQTRAFVDEHAEFVVLELQHYCGTSKNDPALVALIAEQLGPRLFVQPVEDDGPPLIQRPLEELIGNDGSGRVLVRWDGLEDDAELRAAGRFGEAALPIAGSYANAQTVDTMSADQLAKYDAFYETTGDSDALFKIAWTLTMDAEMAFTCALDPTAPTLQTMAEQTHEALPDTLDALFDSGAITADRHPHIVSVDYLDAGILEQIMRINTWSTRPNR